MAIPGPAAHHNGISIRIGVSRHVVFVRKPRCVYPVPSCAYAAANKAIYTDLALVKVQADAIISVPTSDYTTARRLADWWDDWKIRLRKVLLTTTKIARQGLTKRYRQRLHHLYVQLVNALLVTRTPDTSPSKRS